MNESADILSPARAVLEDGTPPARIRTHRDDLEKGVVRGAEVSATKAPVAAYLNRQFGVRAGGVVLQDEFLEQGAESGDRSEQTITW